MRILLFTVLLLAVGAPLSAQSGHARMTASASVVEAGGASAVGVRVGAASGGFAEVGGSLEIGGRAPRVVAVVEGGAVGGVPLAWRRGEEEAARPGAERVRVVAALPTVEGAGGEVRPLTFVVAHVN